jgi:hypothetical protein
MKKKEERRRRDRSKGRKERINPRAKKEKSKEEKSDE